MFSGAQSRRPPSPRATLLIAAVAFAVGCGFGLDALRFELHSVPTTGTVVSRDIRTYTVQFLIDGRPIQFESAMPSARGSGRSRIAIGRHVPVRYDPLSPDHARVAGVNLWFFPLSMMFVGATAAIGALQRARQQGGWVSDADQGS
jgi:hypothetical protein